MSDAVGRRLKELSPELRIKHAQDYLDLNDRSLDFLLAEALQQAVAGALTPATVRDFASVLHDVPDEVAGRADSELMGYYASNDPGSATDFLQKLMDNGHLKRAGYAVASFGERYGSKNPVAAVDWALRLPDSMGKGRWDTLHFTFDRLNRVDPALAKKRVAEIADPEERRRMLVMLEHTKGQ